MSQDYHEDNIYSISTGFERSEQQILKEKLGGGLFPLPDENSGTVYETAAGNMLSEMFSYPAGISSATRLLHQMGPPGFQDSRQQSSSSQPPPGIIQEWSYADRKDPNILEFRNVSQPQQHPHQMSQISVAESAAAAMQLFLMNPHSRTSSSPAPVSVTPNNNSSHFETWGGGGGGGRTHQGLSLSLAASSLEAATKADQFFFAQHHQQQQQTLHYFNHQMNNNGTMLVGPSTTISSMNVLRYSKYAKPTQELLQEFCGVGFKKNNFRNSDDTINPNSPNKKQTTTTATGGHGGASSSSAKEGFIAPTTLSAAERVEHQKKKVKLLAMLDEACNLYPSLNISTLLNFCEMN